MSTLSIGTTSPKKSKRLTSNFCFERRRKSQQTNCKRSCSQTICTIWRRCSGEDQSKACLVITRITIAWSKKVSPLQQKETQNPRRLKMAQLKCHITVTYLHREWPKMENSSYQAKEETLLCTARTSWVFWSQTSWVLASNFSITALKKSLQNSCLKSFCRSVRKWPRSSTIQISLLRSQEVSGSASTISCATTPKQSHINSKICNLGTTRQEAATPWTSMDVSTRPQRVTFSWSNLRWMTRRWKTTWATWRCPCSPTARSARTSSIWTIEHPFKFSALLRSVWQRLGRKGLLGEACIKENKRI